MFWAISRSLAHVNISSILPAWIKSDEPSKRKVACRLAARGSTESDYSPLLRECLEDIDLVVAKEAGRALKLHRDATESKKLVTAILAGQDEKRLWILLECLLELSDPGDDHQSLPLWTHALGKRLTAAASRFVARRLQERRDELASEAERLDREEPGRVTCRTRATVRTALVYCYGFAGENSERTGGFAAQAR